MVGRRVVKQTGCQADDSITSNAEAKNEWSYTSFLPRILMTCTGTRLSVLYQETVDKTLTLMICMRQAPGSNLSRNTEYSLCFCVFLFLKISQDRAAQINHNF